MLGNMDEFVGLPWLERGRDRDGLDCWGLLALVFAERLGIELPSFSDDYQTTADAEAVTGLIDGHMEPWRPIEAGQERAGDALLMSMGGRPRHVGVVVSPGHVCTSRTARARSLKAIAHPACAVACSASTAMRA